MTNPMKKNSINFVFFGTPAFAAVFLDDLEERGLIPTLVVTTPDTAKGRGLAMTPSPVKRWAQARDIKVLQPEKLNASFAAELGKEAYDVFVVIYYGKLIPRSVFSLPRRGTINIHFSLLPRWKGTSPIRASIVNDDKKAGTSLVLMDEEIDHGPIIAQKELRTEKWPPSAKALEEQATHESAQLLADMLPAWLADEIEARPQNHDLETMCPALEKSDGRIDLSIDPYQNLLKIRAFDSTIGTHTFFERGGKKIRVGILDAHLENERLVIDKVKPEGKREMGYDEFLRSGAQPF